MPGPDMLHLPRGLSCLRQGWCALRSRKPHHAHLSSTRRLASVLRPSSNTSHSTTSSLAPHLRPVLSYKQSSVHTRTTVFRLYSSSKMSQFQKITLEEGDGATYPKIGDQVTMEYTGWLYTEGATEKKGTQFDSSVGRGDFRTKIGVGKVIQGWDQGVPQMSLGEKARLIIPGHMAYGSQGFPGLIPPNATLLFDVRLKKIN